MAGGRPAARQARRGAVRRRPPAGPGTAVTGTPASSRTHNPAANRANLVHPVEAARQDPAYPASGALRPVGCSRAGAGLGGDGPEAPDGEDGGHPHPTRHGRARAPPPPARVASRRSSISLEHPQGVFRGAPAALTPSSTAGRVRVPPLAAYLAELHDHGRARQRACRRRGSGCFPGPPGSWPVTGGSLGDRRPRTGADRSGRRISRPSLPPTTGRDGAATAAPSGSTPCGPGLASGRYGVGVALGARRAGTADGIENLTACRRTRTHPAGHEDDSTGSAADALVAGERRIEGCNRGASWHNGLHLN